MTMDLAPEIAEIVGEIDFDPDALHAKYLAERDKRLREDGIGQYVEVKARVLPLHRRPLRRAGLHPRAGLRRRRVRHHRRRLRRPPDGRAPARSRVRAGIRMVESAGDFGGTWYWNRYPGAMCDVEMLLLPAAARRARLHPQAQVLVRAGDPRAQPRHRPPLPALRRRAAADRGHRAALGRGGAALDRLAPTAATASRPSTWPWPTGRSAGPKLPGIPGINDFAGHTFHTSRWDYRYTGGDCTGGLTGLKDKRVGIIGTGATAIQCVPHLGEWAKELYVFQRTPSSVDVRNNAETDPAWAASLTPGWQRRRQDNFNILVAGGDQDEDLVHDGWTDIFRNLTGTAAKQIAAQARPPARPARSAPR